jgi:dolichyl-phosphate-mannose-protein mannosyltransferase
VRPHPDVPRGLAPAEAPGTPPAAPPGPAVRGPNDRPGGAGPSRPAPTTGRRPARARWEGGLLAVILLGGLALRVYGLRWGLPGRIDLNPDEKTVLQIVGRMSWQHLDPGAYFYGGFFYEVCVLVRSLLQALWPGIGEAGLVLAYRSVSAGFGTATVAVLYLLLRRVAPSGPAPLLGAAFLAAMPLHVWDSHFAVTDVTLTFWMTASVTAAVWAYQRPSGVRFVLASALAGLATGTKFNGAFATVAIALAALVALGERRVRVAQVLAWGGLGVGAALLALFVASPHVFLQGAATWRAFHHEMDRVWVPNYGINLGAPGWQYRPYVYQLGAAFPFSFGVALYAALLGGGIYCAGRWRRALVVPFGYAAVYLAVMGRWEFVPIRYYLPVEPALLMAPALALAAGLTAPARGVRRWAAGALAVVLAYTLAFTISTTTRFTDDTRLQAERWLQQRVGEGRDVLTVGAEWYLPTPKGPGVVNLLHYTAMPGVVADRLPDYVVLTSLHYARSYRQQDANVAMWDTVRKGELPYRLAKRFRASYLNWRFYTKLDPMYEGYFLSPTIEVYQRRP